MHAGFLEAKEGVVRLIGVVDGTGHYHGRGTVLEEIHLPYELGIS